MDIRILIIRGLNITDLEVFEAVYRLGRIGAAAKAVGRPQPSVSNILRHLRERLQDPLFVRTPEGMMPTRQAHNLAPYITEALEALKTGFSNAKTFDPSNHQRNFSIFLTDIAEAILLPELLSATQTQAPAFSFETTRHGPADIAIGFFPDLSNSHDHMTLFKTDYVCIAGRQSPFWSKPLSRQDFLSAQHALGTAENSGHRKTAKTLEELSERPQIAVTLPSFLALPAIVAGTQLIATVPRPLAMVMAERADIKILPCPIDLPKIEIAMYWRRPAGKDFALSWLIELCKKTFSPERLQTVFGANAVF